MPHVFATAQPRAMSAQLDAALQPFAISRPDDQSRMSIGIFSCSYSYGGPARRTVRPRAERIDQRDAGSRA